MTFRRSFVVVLCVVALPSIATRALARRSYSVGPADEPQMRELLAKLAAASGTPEPEEKTDADLMYEAMLRWNGEPADSKTIDRVIDQSKRDAAKAKKVVQEKVRHMFWKDPFADDPHRLIPVRQEDRDLLDEYSRKTRREGRQPREARDQRDEVTRLRAELASVRAENARMREKVDMTSSETRGCMADAGISEPRRRRRSEGGFVHSHHIEHKQAQIALASTVPPEPYTPPAPPPPAPPSPPPAAPPSPPPAHGIIIEHLPSPPPAAPVVEARRHGRSSR
jgi:hypothetical protein